MPRAGDLVRDLFQATAEDWTPARLKPAATVLFAPAAEAKATHLCASVLSADERHAADRFLTDELKARFVQRRAFRRYCGALASRSDVPIAAVNFAVTSKGRPYLPALPDCWFSFSACRTGLLAAWSSTHSVGVDIEEMKELEAVGMAERFFSVAETKLVATSKEHADRTFLRLWTLKEAALKSVGEGLPFGLDAFRFELSPMPRMIAAPEEFGGADRFCAYQLGNADAIAALVVHTRAA